MKYKVTLKISYMEAVFLFEDMHEACDFMATAWEHRDDKNGNVSFLMTMLEDENDDE